MDKDSLGLLVRVAKEVTSELQRIHNLLTSSILVADPSGFDLKGFGYAPMNYFIQNKSPLSDSNPGLGSTIGAAQQACPDRKSNAKERRVTGTAPVSAPSYVWTVQVSKPEYLGESEGSGTEN